MLVEIEGLALSIGHVPLLHNVRLSLREGEIYGLLGPNGSGRSTTIAAVLGLLKPSAGRVVVLGRDPVVAAHAHYGRIGVLPEQNGLYNWMTAAQYLGYFAGLQRCSLGAADLADLLSSVGLDPSPRQTVGTFSRGMRQRLCLARALVAEPALLILGEPTNGLDPRGRRDVHDVLASLASRGAGILLCTHLLDDVDRLCHRVGVLANGSTVAERDMDQLAGTGDRLDDFYFAMTEREAA